MSEISASNTVAAAPPPLPPIPKANESAAPIVVRATTGLPAIDLAGDLLADASLKEPEQIVQGLIHRGTKTVIASTSKAGKTWLLLDLAIAVSEGLDFLKWQTTQGKVLFVNFEIPRVFIRERIRHLKLKKQQLTENTVQLNLRNLHIWTLRGLTGDFDRLLERMIEQIRDDKYDLVILDPIYKGMAGKDESASQAVSELCHNIEVLSVETGAAVVYAHHFSKGNQSNKNMLDRMSGSGVFARDADSIVALTPHKQADCYTVEMTLRNFASQSSFVVEFDFPVMKLRPLLKPEELRGRGGRPAETDADDLLQLLPEAGLTFTDWKAAAEALHIAESTFKRRRKELNDEGLIQLDTETKKWRRVQNGD
jgi:hypothetical protein